MLKQSPAQRLGRAGSTLMFVCLFVLTLLMIAQLARSLVMVSVDMDASAAGTMQIQWRDNGSDYAEFKSKKTVVKPGRQAYFFIFWTGAEVDKIRVNPIDTEADITVHNIIIRTLGYDRLVYDTDKQFQDFKPITQLSHVQVANNQLHMHTAGKLAQFEFSSIHTQTNTKNAALIDRFNLKHSLIIVAALVILGFAYPLIHLVLLVLCIVVGVVYVSPFAANYAVITLDMQSENTNQTAVYWAAEHEPYTEQQARRVDTQAGDHVYRLGMGHLSGIQRIRIDPLTAKGRVFIKQLEISAFGFDPIVLNASNQFYAVDFLNNPQVKMTGDALEFVANNDDAFFEMRLDTAEFKIKHTLELYYCLLALLVFMTLLFYLVKLKYAAFYKAISLINIRVGVVILSIMLVQLFWGAEYDIYSYLLSIKVLLLLIALGVVLGFYYVPAQTYVLYFVAFMAIFYNTQLKQQYSTITLELQTAVNSEVAVYWANKFEAYQESKSARIKSHVGEAVYRLDLGRLNDISSIRIDPLASKGRVSLNSITLTGLGYDPIRLNARNNFYAVDFKQTHALSIDGDQLVFDAENADAFFEVQLNANAFNATNVLVCYLVFLVLLVLINVGGSYLKIRYPASSDAITAISLKLGGIILALMLLQLFFSAEYGFYIDYQANELVITTAGEQAQHVNVANVDNNLLHINLLNLAYGVVIVSALLMVSVFYSLVSTLYLLAFLLLCLALSYPIKQQSTRINIDMDSSIDNKLTVYWADEAEIYQEQHSVSMDTHKGLQHYSLAIANFNNVHTVRIEPIHAQGRVDIAKIEMIEVGYAPIVLDAKNDFYAVDRVKKSKATNKELTERLGVEQDKLVYVATGDDAFFELVITPDAFKAPYRWHFYLQLIAMVAGVFICLYWAKRHRAYFKSAAAVITLRVCLVLVTVMVVQMAWLSDYDAHPDEKAHIDSIDYYTHYWQPPVVGDQRSLNTYQYPWGVSRLDDLGVSYLLMGKLKNSITYFTEDTVFTCRVFNSVLMLLLLFGTRNKKFALFILPLLCLPQVWHLFSYANRDGFALWLAILLGWQVANESSSLYQFLYSKRAAEQWRYLLLPAVLLGLLSIELSNYSIFSLFFVAMLIWQGLFLTTQRKQFALRCLVLIVAAGSIYGVRKAVDVSINGFNKQEQKVAFAEAIASPVFKPSVAVTDEGYFGLRLQQKGVAAQSLFTPRWEWQVLTFKSFAGLYGNEFAEYSPEWYYSYVKYLYGLVALILLGTVLRYGDLKAQVLTVLTVIFVLGDLAMGFLYSWLYDFQPQGRYVFPLIPVVMVYLFRMSSLWGRKTTALLLACAMCLFVLAIYSFNTIALRYLTS
ncbi:MAG: hypothetical protein QX197_04465 [Methylococcaceae bacterium]